MSRTVKRYLSFNCTECGAVKEYLEKMALNGYILKSIKPHFPADIFIFEKDAPQEITYAVEVSDNPSNNLSSLSDTALEFIEYCEAGGWTHICNLGNVFFFKTDNKNITPISTNEDIKYQIIKKQSLKFILLSLLIFFVTLICSIKNIGSSFGNAISSSYLVLTLGIYAFAVIFLLIELFRFCFWNCRAKKALKKNKKISYPSLKSFRKSQILNFLFLLISLIVVIYTVVLMIECRDFTGLSIITAVIPTVFTIANMVKRTRMKKLTAVFIYAFLMIIVMLVLVYIQLFAIYPHLENKESVSVNNPSSGVPPVITVYHDEIPLSVADILPDTSEYINNTKNISKSPFASGTSYYSSDKINGSHISYYIFESEYKWVIDRYITEDINLGNFEKQDCDYINGDVYIGTTDVRHIYREYSEDSSSEYTEKSHIEKETMVHIITNDKVITLRGDFNYTDSEFKTISKKLNLN